MKFQGTNQEMENIRIMELLGYDMTKERKQWNEAINNAILKLIYSK